MHGLSQQGILDLLPGSSSFVFLDITKTTTIFITIRPSPPPPSHVAAVHHENRQQQKMAENLHVSPFSSPSCPPGGSLGATLRHVASDFVRGLLSLTPGSVLLYFAALARLKKFTQLFQVLCVLAAVAYVLGAVVEVLTCTALRSAQLFGGMGCCCC